MEGGEGDRWAGKTNGEEGEGGIADKFKLGSWRVIKDDSNCDM